VILRETEEKGHQNAVDHTINRSAWIHPVIRQSIVRSSIVMVGLDKDENAQMTGNIAEGLGIKK
jgi:hypothetical protein